MDGKKPLLDFMTPVCRQDDFAYPQRSLVAFRD